jgi:hypothetical protein
MFLNMRITPFVLLLSLLTACIEHYRSAHLECNQNINWGFVDSSWTYHNDTLGIGFPLPHEYYIHSTKNRYEYKIGDSYTEWGPSLKKDERWDMASYTPGDIFNGVPGPSIGISKIVNGKDWNHDTDFITAFSLRISNGLSEEAALKKLLSESPLGSNRFGLYADVVKEEDSLQIQNGSMKAVRFLMKEKYKDVGEAYKFLAVKNTSCYTVTVLIQCKSLDLAEAKAIYKTLSLQSPPVK